MAKKASKDRIRTGIRGLDEILEGGLIPKRSYLARGGPGSGKTTLGLSFLSTGVAEKEKALFITLSEPEDQIRNSAAALGFDLKVITFLDFSPTASFFVQSEGYDIFSPSEVERDSITQQIIATMEELNPDRVFIDGMPQFRYLAVDSFQFRKQTQSLLRYLVDREATVMFSSEHSPEAPDHDLRFLADGIIDLDFDGDARKVAVTKFRGSNFRDGRHSVRLTDRGMEVFPILVPREFGREFIAETIPSGVPELDELLYGGLERGTVSLITGPTGAGKTTLGLQYMKEAAGRGERSVIYSFEEALPVLVGRSEALSIPVSRMIEQGTLSIVPVEPLQYTPDQFAGMVRQEVEKKKARIIMIDSSAGYSLSLDDRDLTASLHALCKYLTNMGVTVILISEIESITGEFRATDIGISYLTDNIIFLRHIENRGRLQKVIGVLKKRLSGFENTMRNFELTRYGIKIGEPLIGLSGLLTGRPTLIDSEAENS